MLVGVCIAVPPAGLVNVTTGAAESALIVIVRWALFCGERLLLVAQTSRVCEPVVVGPLATRNS